MRQQLDVIIRFAELEASIDKLLKTYDSGMCMLPWVIGRYSCNPDILFLDEIPAVGDAVFQQ